MINHGKSSSDKEKVKQIRRSSRNIIGRLPRPQVIPDKRKKIEEKQTEKEELMR